MPVVVLAPAVVVPERYIQLSQSPSQCLLTTLIRQPQDREVSPSMCSGVDEGGGGVCVRVLPLTRRRLWFGVARCTAHSRHRIGPNYTRPHGWITLAKRARTHMHNTKGVLHKGACQ